MAFKMNKPSIIKGSKAHKKALKELNVNRAGYENLPDGRSKSSAFQQRELTPEEMQAQLDAADKMQVDVAAEKYFTTDLGSGKYQYQLVGDRDTPAVDLNLQSGGVGMKYLNEDGTINERELFRNLDDIIKDADPEEQKMLENQFGYTPNIYGQRTPGAYDPEKVNRYVRQYNNYIKIKPYAEEGYTFQDHQQKLAEYNQEREAEEYNKKLAVDLVRRGDYDTIEDAMNALNKG